MPSEKARALEYSTRFTYKSIMIYNSLLGENKIVHSTRSSAGTSSGREVTRIQSLGVYLSWTLSVLRSYIPNNMSTHRKTHKGKGRATQTLWKPHSPASLQRPSDQYRLTSRGLLTIRARVRCRPIHKSPNVGSLYQPRKKGTQALLTCGPPVVTKGHR
jgi:hypothetical protein